MLQIVLDRSIPKNEAKQKAIQYSMEYKIDKSVLITVAGAANMKLDYNALIEKGDDTMCTLFEEIAKEGEVRGEIRGEAKGLENRHYNKAKYDLIGVVALSIYY